MPSLLTSPNPNEFATIPLLTWWGGSELPDNGALDSSTSTINKASSLRSRHRNDTPEDAEALYPDEHGINHI
jgi:hypothetical protein